MCESGQTPSIRLIVASRLFRSSSTNLQQDQVLVNLVVLGIPRYLVRAKMGNLGCPNCPKSSSLLLTGCSAALQQICNCRPMFRHLILLGNSLDKDRHSPASQITHFLFGCHSPEKFSPAIVGLVEAWLQKGGAIFVDLGRSNESFWNLLIYQKILSSSNA